MAGLVGLVGLSGALTAIAGDALFEFTTDPSATIEVKGNNDQPWMSSGGNPGGFLALTWPQGSQFAAFQFPDIDNGKIVTAFTFKADLRVGNSTGDRAADGFSVSFARSNDPLITGDLGNQGSFAGGIAEGGTTTGIAVCFDTWSGNTLPDSADIEGIIVRVDNKTVNKTSLPTRHGACDDATSLQTGPRNADYWTNGGDPRAPESWAQLCWQKLEVVLTEDAKLTVSWKGRKLLDGLQTTFFPSSGSIILAGRTGGANENTHFDNISLHTTATVADTTPPTTPTNGKVDEAGARHVKISWGAATDNSGKVAYRLERDGTAVGGLLTDTSYTDFDVAPSKSYKYEVYATDISENKSAKIPINVTTVAEIDSPGFLLAQVYRFDSAGAPFGGAGQSAIDTVLSDPKYPNSPDSVYYVNGLSFGEPNFGDTYGENHMVRITTVLTAPESGQFRFFVRSDDASRLYINTTGATLPDPNASSPIAAENGCCGGFEEPGAGDNGDGTFPTSEPIALTAGNKYGIVFLVKEGGGGDWGQVAYRKEGSSAGAGTLAPITGSILTGKGDPVGAAITFTQNPANTSVTANQSVTLSAVASVTSPFGKAPFYQWYHGSAAIPGATQSTYTIPVASAADAGAYSLEVGTIGLTKKSAEGTLTVNTDTKPPAATSASGMLTTVTVNFDEPVVAPSATTAANYAVSGGVTVSSATQLSPTSVSLKTSALAPLTAYTVTLNGVKDNAGNPVAANSTVGFTSWKFEAGKVKFEYWSDIGTVNVEALRADSRYPNNPSGGDLRDTFNAPVDRAENFGGRLSGWVKPASSGDYVFFISSDDHSELWLSTDDSPTNIKKIAIEPEWNGNRAFATTDRRNADAMQNRSDTYTGTQWPSKGKITLTAGNLYYMEAVYKEGGGGDNCAVAWKLASAADPVDGDPAIGGAAVYGTFTPPPAVSASVGIARDGSNVKVTYTGTLQSAATVTGPYTDVAGATSPYSTAPSAAAAYFRSRQ